MRKQARGFSLLELMITVAIIGILAAIALPNYSQYVLRSNRTVGKTAIMKLVGQQESFFADRKTYAVSWATLLGSTWGTPIYVKKTGDLDTATGTDRVYSLTLAAYNASALADCSASGAPTAPATRFIVVATPINQQTKDTGCGKICYASTGEKDQAGASTDCWAR